MLSVARPGHPTSPGHRGKSSSQQGTPGTCVGTMRAPGPFPRPGSPSRVESRSTCKGLGAWASLHCSTLADPCILRVGRPTDAHCRALVQAGKELGGSAPSWPWPRFRGCVPSPRDQQALEGSGTSVWRKSWAARGGPGVATLVGRGWPRALVGCNGATNHGRWQRPAGLVSPSPESRE